MPFSTPPAPRDKKTSQGKRSKTLSWPRPLGRGSESNSSPQLAPKQNCAHNFGGIFGFSSLAFISSTTCAVLHFTGPTAVVLSLVIKTYTPIACHSVLFAKAKHPGLLLFAAVSIVLSAFLSCNRFNWLSWEYYVVVISEILQPRRNLDILPKVRPSQVAPPLQCSASADPPNHNYLLSPSWIQRYSNDQSLL